MSNLFCYFEDIEIGLSERFGAYQVTREEVISFATKWDPQPFHLDEVAAEQSLFAGLTACSAHIMAIQSILAHSEPKPLAVLAGLAIDGLKLVTPARPGDTLSMQTENLEKRLSKSRPNCGIVTRRSSILNQHDQVITTQVGKVMVRQSSQ